MNERKMSKEQIEGVITDLTRFQGTVDFTYEGMRALLLDALHDLRLADVEIERLRRIEKREAEHDCFKWLDGWIELYESDGPADGKAQGFIDWVNQQPMSGGG